MIYKVKNGIGIIELDADFNQKMKKQIINFTEILETENIVKIVVDMSKTKHMDHAAFHGLIEARAYIRNSGGDMKIAGINYGPMLFFRMAGVEGLFEFHDNIEEAFDSYE